MLNIKEIADKADMIVSGYAFTKDGDTVLQERGILTDKEIRGIQAFIKDNDKEMYITWSNKSDNGYYGEE